MRGAHSCLHFHTLGPAPLRPSVKAGPFFGFKAWRAGVELRRKENPIGPFRSHIASGQFAGLVCRVARTSFNPFNLFNPFNVLVAALPRKPCKFLTSFNSFSLFNSFNVL